VCVCVCIYAYSTGIRIVPELDLPGHAQGWGAELTMCCPGVRTWGVPLQLHKNHTYEAIEGVLRQIVDIFKDPLIHLGGDEFSTKCFAKGRPCENGNGPSLCSGVSDCLYYFEHRLRNIISGLPRKREIIRWLDLIESHDTQGLSPLLMHMDTYSDILWGMSWRGLNEVLIVGGAQEHWSMFLPRPLEFPLLLTSEAWYIPPRPNADQKKGSLGCNECFKSFYISPWGPKGKGLFEGQDVTKKNLVLPDAIQRRIKGGTVASFEVPENLLKQWHSWMLACAVAERLWSSSDRKDAVEAYDRLISNKVWMSWQSA